MNSVTPLIDVAGILSGLKDFQRATVDYVFRRLWIDKDRTHRFLVADEVGLGKTLVAKGVIAKSIEYLQARGIERIDVVYICSNADIARQNLSRLAVLSGDQFTHVTRLTLLPTRLKDISRNRINFVSFTPATSFAMGQSGGQASERVLLYCMLEEAWGFGRATGPMNLFQGAVRDADWFRGSIRQMRPQDIDRKLHDTFLNRLAKDDAGCRNAGKPGLRDRFNALVEQLPRSGSSIERSLRKDRDRFIADLRRTLARTCIDALEPDLVILDEFQRFKHLLQPNVDDEDNPAQELAQVMFDHEQHEELGKTRVLLLSATPYRMYTTAGDSEADNHYDDFADTLRFLQDHPENSARAEQLLKQYKKALFLAPRDGAVALIEVKAALEKALTKVMVRTERLAGSPDRNGMLREIPSMALEFTARDARSFCASQQIARSLEQPDVTEYWKAAPYLLSFAKDYAISGELQEATLNRSQARLIESADLQISRAVRSGSTPVDPAHPRLRWLLAQLTENNMWRMLWLPASLPYYATRHDGPAPTKRLVFSSWRLVPRSIATLVSLEAERQLHGSSRKFALPDAVTAVRQPIVFNLKEGAPRGLNMMCLLYPSFALATIGDPLRLAAEFGTSKTVDELLGVVETRVRKALNVAIPAAATDGRVDDRWYWWAPVLLDAESDSLRTKYWLDRSSLAEVWASVEAGSTRQNQDDAQRGWGTHVMQFRQVVTGRLNPLGRPPDDLPQVLALLAIAGPAVCALRALGRGNSIGTWSHHPLRDAAASVGYSMRTLFNVPEVVSMLRGETEDDEAYWKSVLRYCADDNLQAVFDEWAHILPESLGVSAATGDARTSRVAEAMREVLTLRAAQVVNERFTVVGAKVQLENERYRSRFALRFGEAERGPDDKDAIRPAAVRAAFNSPFWPFVLASTTVGQEGLDFHQYCHAVVHWNLPYNPVDLEQREGRVHRYKGHAVRKNIAMALGASVLQSNTMDPWTDLFARAIATRPDSAGDIVPFWVYHTPGGVNIERHVPSLPLSRDRARLESLRRALVLYRMAFGQPRQDELVSYLARVISPDQMESLTSVLRIDLSPPALPSPV